MKEVTDEKPIPNKELLLKCDYCRYMEIITYRQVSRDMPCPYCLTNRLLSAEYYLIQLTRAIIWIDGKTPNLFRGRKPKEVEVFVTPEKELIIKEDGKEV